MKPSLSLFWVINSYQLHQTASNICFIFFYFIISPGTRFLSPLLILTPQKDARHLGHRQALADQLPQRGHELRGLRGLHAARIQRQVLHVRSQAPQLIQQLLRVSKVNMTNNSHPIRFMDSHGRYKYILL